MQEREITRDDVAGRARVDKLAPIDPKRAVEFANTIKHPWYRCQALSKAAEHLRGPEQEQALLSALNVAQEQREINRVVSVSSWPIRILAVSSPDLAARHIETLVTLAREETHNLRRTHALQTLALSVANHNALLKLVVPALVQAMLGGVGPRIDRCIRDTFQLVGSTHPELLRAIALHHKANRQQEKLLALIPE